MTDDPAVEVARSLLSFFCASAMVMAKQPEKILLRGDLIGPLKDVLSLLETAAAVLAPRGKASSCRCQRTSRAPVLDLPRGTGWGPVLPNS